MKKEAEQVESQQDDPIKKLRSLAKKLKIRKFDIHAIEEEYEERWKRSQSKK